METKETSVTKPVPDVVDDATDDTPVNVDTDAGSDVIEDPDDPRAGIDPALRTSSLHKVRRGVRQLPPLPGTTHELLVELQNDEADIRWLEERISSDPSLATRLLKMANSSFYSVQSEVVSISRALMTLGFRTSLNVILAASVRSAFRSVGKIPGFEPGGLIRHSVATGVCTAALGRCAPKLRPVTERLFVSGLLHDIGRVAMAPLFGPAAATFREVCPQGSPTPAEERTVLGIDHLEVGRMVVEQWKLPEELLSPVERHHEPVSSLRDEPLTLAVVVADLYLHDLGYGMLDVEEPSMHLDTAIEALELERPQVEEALANFETETDAFLGALT